MIRAFFSPSRLLPLLLVVLAALFAAGPAPGQQDPDKALLLDVAHKKVRAYGLLTRTLAGQPFNLRNERGRVVFLNFWATWCTPCRAEMPAMERLHRKMKGRPFTILAVNIQEPDVLVRKFVQDLGLTFTVLMDPEGDIAEAYNARNLPLTYIIDKHGYITRRALGPRAWDGPAAMQLFDRMMAEGT